MDPQQIETTTRTATRDGSDYNSLRCASLTEVRGAIRTGAYRGHTAGLAPGRLQCNLVIMARAEAEAFRGFCEANPKPCPLVAMTEPGDPIIRGLGEGIDLRTDVPAYAIHTRGQPVRHTHDIRDLWTGEMVGFAIGCSFTFERALIEAGFMLPHIERNLTVPMYRTAVETTPSGPFRGGLVVSMRPIPAERVAEAQTVSARYPQAHGAPVHAGDPAALGIADLARPDWGDTILPGPGEVPVFWACGVTPQNALENALADADLPLVITHRPGRMLIADTDEMAATPLF
ncbi:MAG: putative hydro-lyase [Pseudomonadota bacterium]